MLKPLALLALKPTPVFKPLTVLASQILKSVGIKPELALDAIKKLAGMLLALKPTPVFKPLIVLTAQILKSVGIKPKLVLDAIKKLAGHLPPIKPALIIKPVGIMEITEGEAVAAAVLKPMIKPVGIMGIVEGEAAAAAAALKPMIKPVGIMGIVEGEAAAAAALKPMIKPVGIMTIVEGEASSSSSAAAAAGEQVSVGMETHFSFDSGVKPAQQEVLIKPLTTIKPMDVSTGINIHEQLNGVETYFSLGGAKPALTVGVDEEVDVLRRQERQASVELVPLLNYILDSINRFQQQYKQY